MRAARQSALVDCHCVVGATVGAGTSVGARGAVVAHEVGHGHGPAVAQRPRERPLPRPAHRREIGVARMQLDAQQRVARSSRATTPFQSSELCRRQALEVL